MQFKLEARYVFIKNHHHSWPMSTRDIKKVILFLKLCVSFSKWIAFFKLSQQHHGCCRKTDLASNVVFSCLHISPTVHFVLSVSHYCHSLQTECERERESKLKFLYRKCAKKISSREGVVKVIWVKDERVVFSDGHY